MSKIKNSGQFAFVWLPGFALFASLSCGGVAGAAPIFAGGQTNSLSIPTVSNVVDNGTPGLGVDDVVYGVLNVDNVRAGGSELWNANNVTGIAPIDSFSGYYVAKITSISAFPATSPFAAVVTLGPAAADPNGQFGAAQLASGAMFNLYVDDGAAASAAEMNGPVSDDIAKATDGKFWASLGIANSDAYWSALILKDGTIFSSGGLDFIDNATGMTFGKSSDPACPTCAPVDVHFSTVATDNGDQAIWRYAGSNSVTAIPIAGNTSSAVPEPGTLALLAFGGLWFASRLRRPL